MPNVFYENISLFIEKGLPMNKILKLFSVSAFGYSFGALFLPMPYVVIILPVLFLLSLNAVFAVTAWLISEIYLGNYQISGANPRTFIALALGVIFLCREIMVYRGANLRRTFGFLKIPLLLLFLGLVINIVSGAKGHEYSRWLVTLISNMMVVLVMGFGIRNEKDLRRIVSIFLAIVMIDCAIGILQYAGIQQAYDIRAFLSKTQIYSPVGRILGLSRNIIEYSYLLLLGFFLFAGHVFSKEIKSKNFIKFGLIILAATLIINATRSAIGGVFAALIVYVFFHQKIFHEEIISRRKVLIGLTMMVLLFAAVYLVFQGKPENGLFSKKWMSFQDTSAVGRLSRFQLAADVSLHHPLGIGTVNYEKYLYAYWTDLPTNRGISLNEFSVHNNFLRTILEYGFLGGILLVFFLITLFRRLTFLFTKTNDAYMKGILFAIFYFLCAYIFHIFFHNFGPMYGDNLFWFMTGLLVCAANITYQKKQGVGIDA